MKKIVIKIELPSNWLDQGQIDNLSFVMTTVKDTVEREVKAAVVEKIIKEIEIPEIKIDKAKLTDYVHQKIAEKIVEDKNL